MAIPGLSTLGIEVGYAVVTATSSLPAAVTSLPRCNNIGGIEFTMNSIDASALEDYVTKRVAGRADSPETIEMTFNNTSDVRSALNAMLTAYATSLSSDPNTLVCIEVYDPKDTTDGACWFFVQPPTQLGMSEISQNSLKTIALSCTLVEYHGYDAGVAPTDGGSN